MNIIRKFCADGRSSTLSLIECDVTGDARQLAELACVLVHQLAAATGRDPQVLLDDIERQAAARR